MSKNWVKTWQTLPDVVWIDSPDGKYWVNQLVLVIFEQDGQLEVTIAEYDRMDPKGPRRKAQGLNQKGEWVECELMTVSHWAKLPCLNNV
jgi:hypothetical protein